MNSRYIVNATTLADALQVVTSVTQVSSNSAVYKCCYVRFSGKRLIIRGTDLVTFIERSVPVLKSSGEGSWLVVSDILYHYVRSTRGKLSLTFGESSLEVKSSRDKAVIKLRDCNDYTKWPKWSELKRLPINGGALAKAIEMVAKSASPTMIQPILHNVSVAVNDGSGIDVQASNQARLQVVTIPAKLKKLSLLMPYTAATRVGEMDKEITEVGYSSSKLGFRSKKGYYYFLLGEGGEFPNFKAMIPAKPVLRLLIVAEDLFRLIDVAKGFVDAKYRKTQFTATPEGVEVLVDSGESGVYTGKIKAVSGKGRDITIPADLLDFATFSTYLKSKKVIMEFYGEHLPIRLLDPADRQHLYVFFPLNIEEEKKSEDES